MNSRTVSEFKYSLQLIKCWSCTKVMSRFVSLVGQYILFSLQYMLKYIIIKQKWRLDVSDYSVNIGLLENTAVVRIWVRHHLSDINEIGPQCFRPFSLQYIEKGLLTMLTLFSWKSFWRSMYHGTINCQLEKERKQKLPKIVLFCRALFVDVGKI